MPSDSIVFDRAADFYDETRGFPSGEEETIAKLIVEAGRLDSSSHVLEIGVGTGRIALPVSPHVNRYIGIDLSRRMMDRLIAKRTTEPLEIAIADATMLPFASNTFDAVVVVHVFHLIPGYVQVVGELQRVLKVNGRLIFGQNQRGSGSDVFKPMVDAWDALIPPEKQKRVGLQENDEDTFLANLGWRQIEPRRTHPFKLQVSPRQHFERHQRRMWSGSWQVSEEDHSRAVEEIKRVLEANYPDPDKPFEIETGFNVDVYLLPG